jgi:hypothetical protein
VSKALCKIKQNHRWVNIRKDGCNGRSEKPITRQN